MKNMRRVLGLLSVTFVLCFVAGVQGAEVAAPQKLGSSVAPGAIDKALTGDLAMTAAQMTKLTASYDSYEKTVQSVREKLKTAIDADAKKALYPEIKAARDAYMASMKAILNDAQNKSIDAMLPPFFK